MALTLAEKTRLCALMADSKKAADIVVLDVQPHTSVADYFLICSGASDRQVQAIAEAIEEALRHSGERPLAVEGYQQGSWILIDCIDLIVHVFDEESRRFYDLERLWHQADRVEMPGVVGALPLPENAEALLVEEG
ncbi:MAG: ribosome silencing factor [Candidatus Tectimicrobiota bacterium]